MLPEFLGSFRSQLEQYRLDYLKILAEPHRDAPALPLTQSKFLGTPFLPISVPYPLDELGKPMILLAQINFAETPALEPYPTHGLLQLFVSATNWYSMDDHCILYHPSLETEPQTDFSFLTPDLYEDSPIYVEHTLTFSRETEYGGTQDCRFDMTFEGLEYYEYQKTLPKAQQKQLDAYCYNTGHKIGGYALFNQQDPRDCSVATNTHVLLLQIDIDEEIMFGDSGVAHVFISPEALKSRDFEQAYFQWDCC
ncbi:DUF1963 domain-containing protein [Hymenobacter lapidiphilus]|uniref:YwqG family protein n=1 Tax=Hymenobacter sp. CCM 8763 TaxID=2303334 RepID=UPI000E346611|nr:YwqG family protein [Hymenobacter sp. CCM 8763]RFP66412.1 DUF1963 domain-containing protein [Hymenobacter sp. CCM 8763]